MQAPERERLTQLVQRMLRYPDQARDIEIDRAAARLMAARSDTPQMLLQRVLVLEAALQQSSSSCTAWTQRCRPPP